MALVRQLARFGGWTLLSASVSLGLPILLHEVAGVPEKAAVAIALVAAFLMNFVGLRSYVFRKQGRAQADFGRFLVTSLFFRVFEYLFFLALFDLAGFDYMVALLVPLIVSFGLKFVTYRLLVFGRPSGANSPH